MKIKLLILLFMMAAINPSALNAKTLIVYYSYTNNVESIVNELRTLIEADVVEIEPAVKGLDYAANNYAIGSAQIAAIRNNPNNASSYPGIDPVDVNLDEYDTIIIGAPLWWSQMAAPLQTFFFQNGNKMAGKHIGLIVSSHSSGIGGVEADAKRLIPKGEFVTPSLWIRSAQTADAKTLLSNWLTAINYSDLSSVIPVEAETQTNDNTAYTLSGIRTSTLSHGIYIINGKKTIVK